MPSLVGAIAIGVQEEWRVHVCSEDARQQQRSDQVRVAHHAKSVGIARQFQDYESRARVVCRSGSAVPNCLLSV